MGMHAVAITYGRSTQFVISLVPTCTPFWERFFKHVGMKLTVGEHG